jgi:hypothetical protein
MLTTYVIGNLLGRLVMSYLLVLVGCVAIERGNWRNALLRSRRWQSWVCVAILFALALAGSVGSAFGPGLGPERGR